MAAPPRYFALMFLEIILAARSPAQSQLHRCAGTRSIGWILRAFIECHNDVCAESDLNLHRLFRTEKVGRSIEVRPEGDAFFANFAKIVEAENLEAAGVGEDGAIPRHEAMQTAHLANGLDSGTQIKMVGIGQENLDAEFFQYILRNTFDGCQRSNRHEDRRFDLSVRSDEFASAGRAAGGFNLKVN